METLYATPESKAALYILGLVEELEAAGVLETSGGVGLGLTEKGQADYEQLKATGFTLTKDETEKAYAGLLVAIARARQEIPARVQPAVLTVLEARGLIRFRSDGKYEITGAGEDNEMAVMFTKIVGYLHTAGQVNAERAAAATNK